MNTRPSITSRPRRNRDGSAVIVMLALLAVMVILIAANTAALNRLTQEVKGMEKRQTQRLDPSLKPGSTLIQTNFSAAK